MAKTTKRRGRPAKIKSAISTILNKKLENALQTKSPSEDDILPDSTIEPEIEEIAPWRMNQKLVLENEELKNKIIDLMEERDNLKKQVENVTVSVDSQIDNDGFSFEDSSNVVNELRNEIDNLKSDFSNKIDLLLEENNKFKKENNNLVEKLATIKLRSMNLERELIATKTTLKNAGLGAYTMAGNTGKNMNGIGGYESWN